MRVMLLVVLLLVVFGGGRRRNRNGPPHRSGGHGAPTTLAGSAPDADDVALAYRFATGDEAAVRDAYARYGRAVFTVAFSTLRDRQLAAEAVQVTFLKAWRAADRYDPARPLAPWLYSIARRAAIDVARSERRHDSVALEDRDAPVSAPDLDRAWDAWQVRRAVDALDEVERTIVRLQYFEQVTLEEIGRRLDMPLGTVKSRSYRARQRLNAALAHLQEVEA